MQILWNILFLNWRKIFRKNTENIFYSEVSLTPHIDKLRGVNDTA